MLFKNPLIHRSHYKKSRLTNALLYSILKNAFERFYFLRKMADCYQAFFYNKTQSANFFSENSIGFYSFTFEKYNSLAFKIIIKEFSYEKANLDRCFVIGFGGEFCICSQR
ncbi:hypothetical protein HpMMM63_06660 [Helicobacter pylori]